MMRYYCSGCGKQQLARHIYNPGNGRKEGLCQPCFLRALGIVKRKGRKPIGEPGP
jgi:hypothetical protein